MQQQHGEHDTQVAAHLRKTHQAQPMDRAKLKSREMNVSMAIVLFGFNQVSAHMRSRLWYTPVRAVVSAPSPYSWRSASRFMSNS